MNGPQSNWFNGAAPAFGSPFSRFPWLIKEIAVYRLSPLLLVLVLAGCSAESKDAPDVPKDGEQVALPTADPAAESPPAESPPVEPTDESGLRERGNAYFNQGSYDEAIDDYTAALAIKPDARSYYNRGVAHTAKNEFDQAVADYNEALKLDPKNSSAYFNRGIVLHKMGKTALGIADLTRAMELEPEDANVPFNRALLYLGVALTDKAIADFDKALALNPKFVDG